MNTNHKGKLISTITHKLKLAENEVKLENERLLKYKGINKSTTEFKNLVMVRLRELEDAREALIQLLSIVRACDSESLSEINEDVVVVVSRKAMPILTIITKNTKSMYEHLEKNGYKSDIEYHARVVKELTREMRVLDLVTNYCEDIIKEEEKVND